MSGGGALLPETTSNRLGLRGSRGPVLLSMMLSTAIVAMDSTILSTTVPTIVGELGGFESYPWLFSIYLLAMAVTVPVYSKLADTFGRKPVMLFGIGVFLLGSILAGCAWGMPALIAFRAVQGIGAGAISPMTQTIIGDIYTVQERAKVQGYVSSMWGAASVIGPTLGALFAWLDAWRWIFFVNIPICLIAAWLVWTRYHERLERHPHRIDVGGAVTVTAGLALLILGVLEGGNAWAWDSVWSIGVFVLGGLLLVAFVLIERRAAEPVLPLGMLRRPLIVVACVLGIAQGATLMGLTAFVPTYLEIGGGASAFIGGIAVAVTMLGWPIASGLAGRLYLRYGYRTTTIIGTSLVLVGAAGLALLGPMPDAWLIAACCFVIGWGFGWSTVPTLVAAQSSVEWRERGVVTGSILFSRSLGQALGAAILGAVSNAVIAARGGNENDPATIVQSSTAVFIGVGVIAIVHFGISLWMPRHIIADPAQGAVRADPQGGIDVGPEAV